MVSMNANLELDWADLGLLHEVARAGSLLAAARRRGLSVSTLSRRMAALEAALGRRLFERGARGVVMTPAGRELSEMARSFEERLSGLVRALPSSGEQLEGTIRISVGDGFAPWISEVVARFHRAHPRVRFELALEERVIDLARREADVAIRTTHRREPSLVYRELGELAFGLFASPAYLARAGRPRRARDLSRLHAVLLSAPLDRLPAQRWAAARMPVALRATTFGGQLAAVRAGVGVAPLPIQAAEGLERVLPARAARALDVARHALGVARGAAREGVRGDALGAPAGAARDRPLSAASVRADRGATHFVDRSARERLTSTPHPGTAWHAPFGARRPLFPNRPALLRHAPCSEKGDAPNRTVDPSGDGIPRVLRRCLSDRVRRREPRDQQRRWWLVPARVADALRGLQRG
jgi:DNA-binding transcriptional LysR family regulator